MRISSRRKADCLVSVVELYALLRDERSVSAAVSAAGLAYEQAHSLAMTCLPAGHITMYLPLLGFPVPFCLVVGLLRGTLRSINIQSRASHAVITPTGSPRHLPRPFFVFLFAIRSLSVFFAPIKVRKDALLFDLI